MRPLLICLLCTLPLHAVSAERDVLEILRAEIERASRQRDEARKEFLQYQSDAENRIEMLSTTQRELHQRLESADKSLLELEASARMSASAVARAEAEIERRDRELAELRTALQANRERLEELSARPRDRDTDRERSDLEAQLARQTAELEEMRGAREQAAADREALEQMNRELRGQLQTTKRDEALSNAKLAALESRLGVLSQELENLYRERSELEQEQERLQGVVQDLTTRLAEAEANSVPRTQLEELQSLLESLREENRGLRQDLERREEIPDLRLAFAAMERERDLLQAKQKTLSGKVADLEASLNQERKTSQREKQRRREAEDELADEKRIRKDLEREIRRLEAGLEAATDAGVPEEELAEVSMLLADMKEENLALRGEADQYRMENDRLMEELTDTRDHQTLQIRDLQAMLGQQMEQLTTAQRRIESLEARTITLDSVREERNRLIQIRDKSRNDMRVLARHIYDLREQLVESRTMEQRLHASDLERQRLHNEIGKRDRLAEALRREQTRQEQVIRDLRARLAAELEANATLRDRER